ncbi:MAG TPA: general secretion pathway protein GspB [Thermomonas sp.]|jgi:general secretion pathway protein B|nr:general secretion pathway protein GspB [Thermomonas sp.]
MSLILEALRKSEAERRRDSTPDVALELPPPAARASRGMPTWLWPLLICTAALLALGVWLGTRMAARDHAAAATPSVATDLPPLAEAPAASALSTARQPTAPVRAPATPALAPATPPAASMAHPNPPVLPPPPPVATAPMPAPPTPTHTARPVASNDAPDLGDTSLPAVKLSMHMWDADPARRFVILDGQRMGEGDRSGALSVIAIERNGVVIEHNGQRARIPLP